MTPTGSSTGVRVIGIVLAVIGVEFLAVFVSVMGVVLVLLGWALMRLARTSVQPARPVGHEQV